MIRFSYGLAPSMRRNFTCYEGNKIYSSIITNSRINLSNYYNNALPMDGRRDHCEDSKGLFILIVYRFSASLQISNEDVGSGRPASASLSIQEATSFRQIIHLVLRFSSPGESDLKRHLGGVVRQYKVREFDGG